MVTYIPTIYEVELGMFNDATSSQNKMKFINGIDDIYIDGHYKSHVGMNSGVHRLDLYKDGILLENLMLVTATTNANESITIKSLNSDVRPQITQATNSGDYYIDYMVGT